MTGVLVILAAALAVDLAHAWVRPFKAHKLCRGRGHDPYCNYTGKVLRFGARWVHPELRKR